MVKEVLALVPEAWPVFRRVPVVVSQCTSNVPLAVSIVPGRVTEVPGAPVVGLILEIAVAAQTGTG